MSDALFLKHAVLYHTRSNRERGEKVIRIAMLYAAHNGRKEITVDDFTAAFLMLEEAELTESARAQKV